MGKEKEKSTRKLKLSSRRSKVKVHSERRTMESEARRVSMRATASQDFIDRLRAHYRECRRKEVDIECDVQLHLPDGTHFDNGTAKVTNVSASGALLTDLRLKGESFPTGPFILRVTMRGGDYEGVIIKCQPVRFVPDRSGVGVRLDDIYVALDDSESK